MIEPAPPLIISASRRTDLPRFYLPLLLRQVTERRFVWHNPFNGQRRELQMGRDQRAVMVLWSKDFGEFLARADEFDGWPLFFHFTVNGPPSVLEPDMPSLDRRIDQMRALVDRWGANTVRWRFDPIVFWEEGGSRHSNLDLLESTAGAVLRTGVRNVTVSFMDRYRKIDRRLDASRAGIVFDYPSLDEQVASFEGPARRLAELGFSVHSCCEPDLAHAIPEVQPGACIDAALLSDMCGYSIPTIPDRGQRRAQGCGCHRSVDIGCYLHHRCPGRCLYCYARP